MTELSAAGGCQPSHLSKQQHRQDDPLCAKSTDEPASAGRMSSV